MPTNGPGDNARNSLLVLERLRQLAVVSEFEKIQTRLASEISDLLDRIDKQRRFEGNASPADLFKKARLGELLDQVTAEIKSASAKLASLIESAQNSAIDVAGTQAAKYPQLKSDLVTFDAPATRALVGLAGNGQPLAVHFAKIAAPARQAMFDALFFGVATGSPNQAIAREVKDAIGGTTAQAMTIVRTETNRSYREATREFYRAAPSVIGWRWLAALDLNCCPICFAMHGRIFKNKTKMATHPNCLLPGTVVNSPGTVAVTRRWYSGQIIHITTFRGYRLSVTANHPIMTPAGWVAAQFLNRSSDIFTALDSQLAVAAVNEDEDNKPTLIEQKFQAFNIFGMETVKSATDHFHGDGAGGDIDIVRPNSLLQDGFNAAIREHRVQLSFIIGNSGLSQFASFGEFAQSFKRPFLPANRIDRRRYSRSALCDGLFAHSDFCGRGLISNNNAAFSEYCANPHPTNAQGTGDFVLSLAGHISSGNGFSRNRPDRPELFRDSGLFEAIKQTPVADTEQLANFFRLNAGNVCRDRIIDIVFAHYEGNVYNEESSGGFYLANGVMVKNCRCTMVPVFADDAKEPTGPELFAKLNEAQQRTIVGPRRLDLYRQGAELSDFIETNKSAFGIGRQIKPIVRTTFKPNPRELIPASVERLPTPGPVLSVADRTTPK